MKHLIEKPESAIAKETKSLLCALKFFKNRKRNFESVIALSKKASLYQELDGQYLVAFQKSKADARLAMAVLEEMRVAGWDYILFCQGRVVAKKNALRNVLDCYGTASALRDPTKHCHKIFDAPMEHFAARGAFTFKVDELGDPVDVETTWLLPCQALNGFVSFSKEELKNPREKLDAVAESRLATACPLYDSSHFKESPKAKQVTKPKRYW